MSSMPKRVLRTQEALSKYLLDFLFLGLMIIFYMCWALTSSQALVECSYTQKVLFSSVQLLSHVRLFVTPWPVAHQASLSITNSQSLLKLMSIELVEVLRETKYRTLYYILPQEYGIHRSLFKYVKVEAVDCTIKQYERKIKKLKSSCSSANC